MYSTMVLLYTRSAHQWVPTSAPVSTYQEYLSALWYYYIPGVPTNECLLVHQWAPIRSTYQEYLSGEPISTMVLLYTRSAHQWVPTSAPVSTYQEYTTYQHYGITIYQECPPMSAY